MTASVVEHDDGESVETIDLPVNETVQRALHEAVGHIYDELAIAQEDAKPSDEQLSTDVFDDLEKLYVATAEESVADVRISYARE
jgi:hypothetical protein